MAWVESSDSAGAGRLAAVVVVSALAAATLMAARTPADPDGRGPGIHPLSERLFTIPLLMPQPMDVRDSVLPMGAALLVLCWAVAGGGGAGWQPRWFEVVGAATTSIAIGSAFYNGCWEISRGWIFQFTSGWLWASALSRLANRDSTKWIMCGTAIIAVAGSFFTYWTRHETGVAVVDTPIGPVTLTAGMGALWSAGSGVFLIYFLHESRPWRERLGAGACALLSCAAGSWLLVFSNRKGGYLGVGAAIVVVVLAEGWDRCGRRARTGIVIGLLVLSVAGAVALGQRVRNPEARIAADGDVRMLYLGKSLAMLPRSPVLGAGPDMFVCRMTTELSPLRAHMPRVLQGMIDETAHNEWMQAIFEIGIPGGLLYAVLPIGAVLAGLRGRDGPRRTIPMALAAGLVAVCAMEATSINLRYDTMPSWYWTLIGLLLAMEPDASARRGPDTPWRVGAGIVGVCAASLACGDLLRSHGHAQARLAMLNEPGRVLSILSKVGPRFGAVNWMQCEYDRGLALADAANRAGGDRSAKVRAAAAAFEKIVRYWPGHPDPSMQLAGMYLSAGDEAAARRIVEGYLRDRDPFLPAANILLSELPSTTAAERFECLVRALREAELDAVLMKLLARCVREGALDAATEQRIDAARELIEKGPTESWADTTAPELVRIGAARLWAAKRPMEAKRWAELAAGAYERLFATRSPYRRAACAETDGFWKAADYVFQADPREARRAQALIEQAERFLIRGVDDTYGPGDPKGDWLGGPGLPADMPEPFRLMWALSGVLHISTGDVANLAARVGYCLPAEGRTPEALRAQRSLLAKEALRAYQTVLPADRPETLRQAAVWASETFPSILESH